MSTLSFEVLLLIFNFLESRDLVQCQLVSKSWNQSSLKLLYSEVTINTEKKSSNYVRTIKRSPQLGKYLENIKFGGLFQKKVHSDIWDTYHLLHTIVAHCPNLLKLNCEKPCLPFWTRLTLAAAQGDLPRLQHIACPDTDNFDSYIYTLLAFKQSITEIELLEKEDEPPNLIDTEAYPMLLHNLNRFPCLETLNIKYKSGHKMTFYDAFINDCKSLKNLSIMTESGCNEFADQEIVINAKSIHPCRNIRTLRCEWEAITSDNQMNYIMQKFPNLKSLFVICGGYTYQYYNPGSVDVLTKFLDFTTNLQECEVNMITEEEKAVDIWSSIINEKFNVTIVDICMSDDYGYDYLPTVVNFKLPKITLQFQPSEMTESRYIKFLSMNGKNVRSFSLGLDMICRNNRYEVFSNLEKVTQAMQLCPLLEELELCNIIVFNFPTNITYQNSEIRSLKLTFCNYWTCVDILKNMSFVFPNLKEVVIIEGSIKFSKSFVKDIIMPNSNLDVIRWQFNMYHLRNSDMLEEFFIRLEINSVERFYIAFEDNLTPITKKQYDHSRVNQIYMNITCQKLNKLIINRFAYTI